MTYVTDNGYLSITNCNDILILIIIATDYILSGYGMQLCFLQHYRSLTIKYPWSVG